MHVYIKVRENNCIVMHEEPLSGQWIQLSNPLSYADAKRFIKKLDEDKYPHTRIMIEAEGIL